MEPGNWPWGLGARMKFWKALSRIPVLMPLTTFLGNFLLTRDHLLMSSYIGQGSELKRRNCSSVIVFFVQTRIWSHGKNNLLLLFSTVLRIAIWSGSTCSLPACWSRLHIIRILFCRSYSICVEIMLWKGSQSLCLLLFWNNHHQDHPIRWWGPSVIHHKVRFFQIIIFWEFFCSLWRGFFCGYFE